MCSLKEVKTYLAIAEAVNKSHKEALPGEIK